MTIAADGEAIDPQGMDPAARRFLAMVALAGAGGGGIAERRASFVRLMRFSSGPSAAVDVRTFEVRGCGGHTVPLRLYAPTDGFEPSPGLIYFHGGGLVAGDLDTHDALCRRLAVASRCRFVSVGYRLAPEHPFPAAILDAYAATRFCAGEAAALGLRQDAIGVSGDSGGGTLAAIVARVLGGRLRLKAQVLLCPVLDCAGDWSSRRRYEAGHLLDAATMAADLAHYAPSRPLGDPHLSPLRAPAAGLPRTVIHTAGHDPLRDEGFAYAAHLRAAGVAVRHDDHPALIHHFYALAGVIPAADAALDAIAHGIGKVMHCR